MSGTTEDFQQQVKKFHGQDINPNNDDFVNKIRKKDWDAQKTAVEAYTKKFDEKATVEERQANYSTLTNNFYDLVTDFYEYGWGQSFHFCRFYKGEPFAQAIARHEHYLSHKLNLKPGMEVLDVGCGVGGPLREIVRFSGATVTGINNNAYQVERVKVYNQRAGLQKTAKVVKGDFMNMPFENNSFDAVYAIEATVHAPTLQQIFAEVFRVLKPGGVFGNYEWLRTEHYDDNNPEHKRIIFGIEEGNSIPKMATTKECLAALKEVGFEVLESQDLAEYDPNAEEPWYSTLQGSYSLSGFRMTRTGRWTTDKMVWGLERVGLAPPGSRAVAQLLNKAADALVDGGVHKIFTPMFFYVARKPATN